MTVREEIRVPSRPVLSHSADAVRAGRYVFVAGILPADETGALVGGDDVVAQAESVFGDTRPASTLVEVSGLVTRGAKIEVDCVAVVP